MLSHGRTGGMTPISLRSPSANKARTTQPTHMLMIEALRLCRRIAASIISCTRSSVNLSGGVTPSPQSLNFNVHLQEFRKRISSSFYNFTSSFVKHIICVTRLFEGCFDLHPVFIGVLIHLFSPYYYYIVVTRFSKSTNVFTT